VFDDGAPVDLPDHRGAHRLQLPQPEPPLLHYIRIDANGVLQQLQGIDIPKMVMMHDFNVTQNYVIFMDLPVCFNLRALETGLPFLFDRDAGARLGVMPRHGTNAAVRWFEIEPCYVFHAVNAHEQGDCLVIHVSRQPQAFGTSNDDYRAVARLWRWTIDLTRGTVTEQQIDDRPDNFGRIDDRLIGLNARYGYLMAMGGEGNSEEPVYGSALWKYDLRDGTCWEQSARRRRARRRAGFRSGGSRFRRGRRLDHQPVARHGIGRVQAVDHRRSGFHGPANGHRPPAATRVVRRARQLGA